MKPFLLTLPRNFVNCFKGRMLLWHLVAIVATFVLVRSGFDWRYATYIGLGVSMTIHWFSDFVAGAIIGTLIGAIVGKSFRDHCETMRITQATK